MPQFLLLQLQKPQSFWLPGHCQLLWGSARTSHPESWPSGHSFCSGGPEYGTFWFHVSTFLAALQRSSWSRTVSSTTHPQLPSTTCSGLPGQSAPPGGDQLSSLPTCSATDLTMQLKDWSLTFSPRYVAPRTLVSHLVLERGIYWTFVSRKYE